MRFAAISSSLLTVASAVALPADGLQRRQGGVITSCSQPGVIALTFDDGPSQYQSSLLEQLDAAGAKATFFVTGTLYGCIYDRAATLQAAYDAGHQIAAHTWTHAYLANLGESEITSEMSQLENALSNILGIKPAYMRPPEGATGGSVVSTVGGMGYEIVTWDVDTQDWNNVPASQSQQAIEQAGTSGNGHIVLMHETVQSTVEELVPWVLEYAAQNNLEMVTVAECLGNGGGEYTEATPGDGSSGC